MSEARQEIDSEKMRSAVKPLVLEMHRLGLTQVTLRKEGGMVEFTGWKPDGTEIKIPKKAEVKP